MLLMLLNSAAGFKIFSSVVIWVLAVIGGFLPLCLKKTVTDGDDDNNNSESSSSRSASTFFSEALNLFAGGVFLSSSMIHLLPDAVKDTRLQCFGCNEKQFQVFNHMSVSEREESHTFPWAYFFYGLGFLIILSIETTAHELHRLFSSHEHLHAHHHTHNEHSSERTPLTVVHRHSKEVITDDVENCSGQEITHAHVHGVLTNFSVLSILVFFSLCFHSVMEGVGIGVQNKPAWDIFIAIIAHKSLAAFALGLEFRAHKTQRIHYVICMALFSLMTPIGIAIGWSVTMGDQSSSAASGICTALAGGTFLFVAVMEIIPQELRNRRSPPWIKMTALCTGYCVFGILAIWV